MDGFEFVRMKVKERKVCDFSCVHIGDVGILGCFFFESSVVVGKEMVAM